jgi:hypothetical protein
MGESVSGFLVSQIGHDVGEPVRAIHRAPAADTLPADAEVVARGPGGERRTPLARWGACWGAHWRVADLGPLPAGRWRLALLAGGTVRDSDEVEVAPHRLFDASWRQVAVEQLERRTKIAHQGEGIGWQDAGCDWQEANSHGACVIGLADLLLHRGERLVLSERERLATQIRGGINLLDKLQDAASGGALAHELVCAPGRNLARDALWAALAWALAARVLGGSDGEAWRGRGRRALAWWRSEPINHTGMDPVAHAWTTGYVPPAERAVGDLALAAWAAAELGEADAADLVNRVCALQVAASGAGPHGHFWQFSDRRHPACVWTHNSIGPDTGDTGMPVALCLAMVLKRLPGHAEAPRWRDTLAAWSEGWFEPGCAASPFGITPRLWRDGWVHFGGLWHGMNAAYGLAAATADELAVLLDRPRLRAIAHSNRQWIAGLHAGLTADARIGCEMTWPAVEPGQALAASMITGVGRRWLHAWMAIPGTICNGFSVGRQFRFDVPADAATDGPTSFTDEDWITHAGGWLMAIARG